MDFPGISYLVSYKENSIEKIMETKEIQIKESENLENPPQWLLILEELLNKKTIVD
jgi:hypothetical protein